jgi:hypothetical protein
MKIDVEFFLQRCILPLVMPHQNTVAIDRVHVVSCLNSVIREVQSHHSNDPLVEFTNGKAPFW